MNLPAELKKMGVSAEKTELIREKDGVIVARVFSGGKTAVLKAFEKEEYRREIENYRILRALGVPTIDVLGESDSAILLEDISASKIWRLGCEDDLADENIARKIAAWYLALHEKGRGWVKKYGAGMYDESDLFTRENLALLRRKFGDLPGFLEYERNFDEIKAASDALPRTLAYNDFFWTNLICARDGSAALMYDYNLLGKGTACSDVENVCSSLRRGARDAFREAYGETDPREKRLNDILSPFVTLVIASRRAVFPKWAQESLDRMQKGGWSA